LSIHFVHRLSRTDKDDGALLVWLFSYRFGGKRKNMSFGISSGLGLKAARDKHHDTEKLLDQGQEPVAEREAKRQEVEKLKHTFRTVGERMGDHEARKGEQGQATIKRERWNLDQLAREIGNRPLYGIATPKLLTAFRRVEAPAGTTQSDAYDRPLRHL
jgi:hypothetical protein